MRPLEPEYGSQSERGERSDLSAHSSVLRERMARLTRMREAPALVPSIRAYYADHPADFISDWGMTFDPRLAEIGRKTTIPFTLFPRQRELVDWILERWTSGSGGLVEKSRDTGVSWLCCAFAAWLWLFRPGTVIGFGSRVEDYVDKTGDPRALFWKIRMFLDMLPKEFLPPGYDRKQHAPYMRIVNPDNGSVISGESGDNIGRGNRASIYFVDESAFIEHQEVVDAALSMTTNCKIDISTPNGAGNAFYRKRHSGKIPVFTFDWRDDPRKNQEWYEKQCQILDPVIVAQEIDRNYEASVVNSFIPGNIVSEAMAREIRETYLVGPLIVGVDVARFGDDKSVITLRRGRALIKQVVLEKLELTDLAGHVREEIEPYRRHVTLGQIAVDTDGIGAGVADILRQWFSCVVDVNSARRLSNGRDFNMRAFIWREMREWLRTAVIPRDCHELRTELTALRYSYKNGLLLMESKDIAKARGVHSPDRADSLAMTFAMPVAAETIIDIPINQADMYVGY
jgi:hypothetical protein